MTAHGYQRPKGEPAPTKPEQAGSLLGGAAVELTPFLSTIVSLVLVMIWAPQVSQEEGIAETFVSAVKYATVFGAAISAPLSMVATRYLGDRVYNGDWSCVAAGVFPAALTAGACAGGMAFFFLQTVDLGLAGKTGVFCLTVATAMSWIVISFVGTVRSSVTVAKVYAAAAVVSTGTATAFASRFGSEGVLFGYASGQVFALWLLLRAVLGSVGFPSTLDWRVITQARAHVDLLLTGAMLGTGFFVDQIVFAFSEVAVNHRGFVSAPVYDSCMVIALFSAVPVNAVVMATMNRRISPCFFEFTRTVYSHCCLDDIEAAAHAVGRATMAGVKNIARFQATMLLVVWLVAGDLLVAVGLERSETNILRLGAIGVSFMGIMLYCILVLFYLDRRHDAFVATSCFFVVNVSATWASIGLGPQYYGIGFALANVLGAALSSSFMVRAMGTQTMDTFLKSESEQERACTRADYARRGGGLGIYRPV